MINVNELRIGNIIKDRYNGSISQVSSIQLITNSGYEIFSSVITESSSKVDDLEGILLTEDILLKCGFNRTSKIDKHINNNGVGYESPNPDFNVAILANKTFVFVYVIGDSVTFTAVTFKYLHQLQNLYFALTGKELNIEL